MSGARHRRKAGRIEREVVDRHRALGVHAERYPLSGPPASEGPVMTSTCMYSAQARRRSLRR